MSWFEIVPTFLSAIASIGAAIAAIISLRISKQAISISESNALASHHLSATLKYTELVKELQEASSALSEISFELWGKWTRDIECFDNYHRGGTNPRPLRHVLSNGSEMLANYGENNVRWGRSSSRAILSIIRFGICEFSEKEYEKFLKKADGEYQNFDEIFGKPKKSEDIGAAPAFRWACYQLNKRVGFEDWRKIWDKAWLENEWFYNYEAEYLKVKPIFERANELLKLEKSRLAHSAFPLNSNAALNQKYDQIFTIINHVIEDADSDSLVAYKDWKFPEELSHLVLCSMATRLSLHRKLDDLYILAHE
ncbi:hypothetical protein FR932_13485 [Moritella marina ATCC 15381]|uniref:Uncharacterized protein n=1 Tax=Moritella marina ATCC 15381 TaxID=1202962 RepID=A0A5J6WPD4_MORMI|nr:hypothetical protein [Moritella marina]QFI38790.1 hypothetical protein FR932_13485 [Moritella marina ATCC 15381]